MGGRYIVSGVQLGMLIAIPDQDERKKEVEKITELQHLENSDAPLMADISGYRKLLDRYEKV